jgi:hypothetical protein
MLEAQVPSLKLHPQTTQISQINWVQNRAGPEAVATGFLSRLGEAFLSNLLSAFLRPKIKDHP